MTPPTLTIVQHTCHTKGWSQKTDELAWGHTGTICEATHRKAVLPLVSFSVQDIKLSKPWAWASWDATSRWSMDNFHRPEMRGVTLYTKTRT
eukprot:585895-Amphidinium_carterae.1